MGQSNLWGVSMLELIICTVMGSCLTIKQPCPFYQCALASQPIIAKIMEDHPGHYVKRITCGPLRENL